MACCNAQRFTSLKRIPNAEVVMKGPIVSIATVAALMLGGANAAIAQDYPTFGRDGFPLTPLQLQVLDSHHVQELVPTSTLARDGMPASPHQLRVLRPMNRTPR
jgi:hypothetical protein